MVIAQRQTEVPILQQIQIAAGVPGAPRIFTVQILQLDPEYRRLDLVQPAVPPGRRADITLTPAVLPESLQSLSQIRVPRENRTPVADGTQVFGWIKAECGGIAPGACLASGTNGSMRLRSILQYLNAVFICQFYNCRHVRRTAVEMHGHDHLYLIRTLSHLGRQSRR